MITPEHLAMMGSKEEADEIYVSNKNLNLDVESPDQVESILRNAVDVYEDSAIVLESAWGDRQGRPWSRIARILERAADSIAKLDL